MTRCACRRLSRCLRVPDQGDIRVVLDWFPSEMTGFQTKVALATVALRRMRSEQSWENQTLRRTAGNDLIGREMSPRAATRSDGCYGVS